MGAKRALIVDDSKSARLFLARVLEKYDIDVDSAENAEAAIDYLSSNRPDVIFMDHLMPGMDGLQAVRAIKNDPRTATIPIMMYTSQEGEVYLGQARALGALGVLPKQIKPADVSKVLYQLHLVPDRRTSEQSSFSAVNVRPEHGPADAPRALTESTLREHFAELRRALVAGVDTQTERITSEVRALLLESLPPPSSPAPAPAPGAEAVPPSPSVPWAWVVACAALLIALTSSALWWRSVRLLERLEAQVTQLNALSSTAGAAPAASAAAPGNSPAAAPPVADDSKPAVIPVPYGAEPLAGTRLDLIRQQLYRLVRQKVTGVADIKTFAGRFCLIGSAAEGYSPAPDETVFSRCDLVGNPSEEALTVGQRTPLALANLIGEIRSATHGALDVQVSAGDAANVLVPYPPATTELAAGEWNRAAVANNRVEIRLH
jgi:CheY-like chemotaxis protein